MMELSMDDTPPLTEERLHHVVAALREEIRALRREVAALALRWGEHAPALLSMRQAAKRLGIGRTDTLPHLIAQRRIRTVTLAGRTKIPLSEIERIEHEGTGTMAPSTRATRATRSYSEAPYAADEVRALLALRRARRGGS